MEDLVRKAGYTFHADVEEALAKLDQGFVLDDVPIVCFASGKYGVLPVTKERLVDRDGGVQLAKTRAMITSQTCDLRGPGGLRRYPGINVVPVYDVKLIDPRYNANDAKSIGYLVAVTGEGFEDAAYVADLRFESFIEKSVVVGRAARDGFASNEERVSLAKKLSDHRRRGGFDGVVKTQVIDQVETLPRELAGDVYEFRIFVDPSPTRATAARLIVAVEPGGQLEAIREHVAAWYDDLREVIDGVVLMPALIDYTTEISVEETRASIPFCPREFALND